VRHIIHSRSARDRDRLRQQVLEDRGWQIHRIWSTDWFQRPEEHCAVLCRDRSCKSRDDQARRSGHVERKQLQPESADRIERNDGESEHRLPENLSARYEQANFTVSDLQPISDIPAN